MSNDNTTNVSHTEAAKALMEKIQALRDSIPNLAIPESAAAARRLAGTSALSHDFVEMTVAATENSDHLAVAGAMDPLQMRDLLSFAEAYEPAVAQAEALTRFLKHTVKTAKSKAGAQALLTYSVTQRLAKQPATAYLRPIAEAMRQKLGRRGRAKAQPQPAPDGTPTA